MYIALPKTIMEMWMCLECMWNVYEPYNRQIYIYIGACTPDRTNKQIQQTNIHTNKQMHTWQIEQEPDFLGEFLVVKPSSPRLRPPHYPASV